MRSFYLQSCRPTYFSNISATITWFFWSITLSTQWLSSKESTCNQGDMGSIPVLGRSPGGGHGNPLQYSCLGSPMDRGAWQTTVHKVKKRIQLKWLSTQHKYRVSQGVWVLNTHAHTHTPTQTHTNPACQWSRHKSHRFDPWFGKILWRRAWQPIPVLLPGRIPGTEEPGRLQPMGLQS